jgi:predicted P-loop ATPase
MTKLIKSSKKNPCPICSKEDWCYQLNTSLWCCKRSDEAAPGWHRTNKQDSDGAWYFAIDNERSDRKTKNQELTKQEAWRRLDRIASQQQEFSTQLTSAQRDPLIRSLSQYLGLTLEHHQMLSNRGLTDEQIKEHLFFSIEQFQKVGEHYPLNLPGVHLHKGDRQLQGKGVAIVAIDVDGLAAGWQVMNDDPRPTAPEVDFAKYYWAKGNKSSHLPIGDGELPIQTIGTASNPDTIWACEGLLKPVVASYRIGDRFIGAAGGLFRSSPIQVKAALKNVQTVIIAVDAGDAVNPHRVRHWWLETEFFQLLGLKVLFAWWGQINKNENDIDELTPDEFSSIEYLTKEQMLGKVISPSEYQEAIAPNVKEFMSPKPQKDDRVTTDYTSLAKDLGIVLVQDDKGNIKSKLVELTMDLYNLVGDRLKLNQMTQEYEYEGKPLDLNHIKNFISHNLGYDGSVENCIQAVHAIASKFAFHPVRQYLESLRDTTLADFDVFNNIATLFLGNSDPLANKMMTKALVGAVARVNKPGTKVDTLPVLQGGQGFLKSTFLKVLGGESWFCDDIRDLENKDELAKLARYWIIELAEVDYLMGRKEVESFKRFLSTPADTYRPPYGRANIRHERTCTLFATTNKSEFLKDPTGSRRYWVIKVSSKIDCDLVAKFRDIIWATALAAYDRGDTWWLDDNDELAREERSEEFREPDAWEEIIASKWGSLPIVEYKGSDRVEINQIFDLLDLDNDKRNKPNRNRIASILKLWGFENKTINTEAGKVKAWLRPRTGVDFTQKELTQNNDFKNKVLGKYSFFGSSSNITSSTRGFEVELN